MVGTGGAELTGTVFVRANSEARAAANGVLRLIRRANGYDWTPISDAGATLDTGTGTGACHELATG